MRLRVLACLVLACLVATPAWADYQVRGRFLYRDRVWGPGGQTGETADLPIRLAEVQVVNWDDQTTVYASGETDATGSFVINVTDTQVRNVYIRALSKAPDASNFRARVLSPTTQGVFAVATPPFSAHAPNQNIDFTSTPYVAVPTGDIFSIGEVFNVFDQALDAFGFIASVSNGVWPTRLLTLYWEKFSTDGTFYQHGDASVHLLGKLTDSDGYDDTVILHEIGHYTEYNLSKSDNPGGPHSLSGYYPLTLTWSEGWATFFANMVRQWRGLQRSDLYVDTGQTFLISYSVENPLVGAPGANNEVTVNALLWDVVDTPSSNDTSPGADDDALNLANGPGDFWDVLVNYIKYATTISLEDFWDGWFARGKGHQSDMENLFGARKVEYFPDTFESDGSAGLAKTVVASSPPTHRTIYPAGDQDWFVIGVAGGSSYTFETQNLLSGADTRLDLYRSDMSFAAANDDVTSGNPASRIVYTPPGGLVYLRCSHTTANTNTYGSYDLVVSGIPVPVEVSDVHLTSVPEGIEIRWRARNDGGFSHFEVERAPEDVGPWTVLASVEPATVESSTAIYEYLDRDVEPGLSYAYRLVGVETTGERTTFGPFVIDSTVPARFALHTPYPNPFNPSATVDFELPHAARAWLRVYAADGRLVRTLVSGETLTPGRHQARWDGRDDSGVAAASGVYWFRLESDGARQVRRGVLVR